MQPNGLALAGRIKGDRTDDGLRYLNVTWLKQRKMYNGWVLSRPSACKKLSAWQ